MHYTVKSWNELLSATAQLKLSNYSCHGGKIESFRSRLSNWMMDVWQPKTSRATTRWHMVIRNPVPEVHFRDEEADTRIVLHACSACAEEWLCDALWYTDTNTDVFVLLLAHSKTSTLKRCYIKKERCANFLCNSNHAMLTTASWGALIGVNSITARDNISVYFGKGKWKAVQLLQQWRVHPSYGKYRRKEWSVSNENFKFNIRNTRVWTVHKEVA